MIIIGLSGKSGSGKDTLAEPLVKYHGFTRLAFADKVKRITQVAFDYSDEQLWGKGKDVVDSYWGETPAQSCQRVGTECMRNGYSNDFWIRALQRQLRPDGRYVITDVRFENEAEAVKAWGGKLVRVNRLNYTSTRAPHVSETALDKFQDFDLWLVNGQSTGDAFAYYGVNALLRLVQLPTPQEQLGEFRSQPQPTSTESETGATETELEGLLKRSLTLQKQIVAHLAKAGSGLPGFASPSTATPVPAGYGQALENANQETGEGK